MSRALKIAIALTLFSSMPLWAGDNRGLRDGERRLPARAESPQHVEVFTADVLLRTDGTRVFVLLDSNADPSVRRDGLVDQWFTLQTADTPAPLFAHLPNAVVVHSSGLLRVTSADDEFVFEVIGHEAPDADDAIATRVQGIGLAHNKAPTKIRIADQLDRRGRVSTNCIDCEVLDPDPGGWGNTGGGCSAGGAGSTSCSASSGGSSCSVTCGAGYYACCNYTGPSCKCVRN